MKEVAFKGSKAAAVFFLFTARVFANDASSTDESNNQCLMLVVFVLFFFFLPIDVIFLCWQYFAWLKKFNKFSFLNFF